MPQQIGQVDSLEVGALRRGDGFTLIQDKEKGVSRHIDLTVFNMGDEYAYASMMASELRSPDTKLTQPERDFGRKIARLPLEMTIATGKLTIDALPFKVWAFGLPGVTDGQTIEYVPVEVVCDKLIQAVVVEKLPLLG